MARSNNKKGLSAGHSKAPASNKEKNTTTIEERQQVKGLGSEALQLLFLAFSILLLLGNFSLTGGFGKVVNGFLFGLFGLMEYIFPIFLFLCVSFYIANKGNLRAMVRLGGMILLFFDLGIFFQLIFQKKFENGNYAGLFGFGKDTHTGGGLICGGIYKGLSHIVGNVGTVIIFLVLAIISIVLISGKSFISGVRSGSKKVYNTTRKAGGEYMERRRIRKEEKLKEREREKERDMVIPSFNPDNAPGDNTENTPGAMTESNIGSAGMPSPDVKTSNIPARDDGKKTNIPLTAEPDTDTLIDVEKPSSSLQFTNISRRDNRFFEESEKDIYADEIIEEGRLLDMDIKRKERLEDPSRIVLSDTEFNPSAKHLTAHKGEPSNKKLPFDICPDKSVTEADEEFIVPAGINKDEENDTGGDVPDVSALMVTPDISDMMTESEKERDEAFLNIEIHDLIKDVKSGESENEPALIAGNIEVEPLDKKENEDPEKENIISFDKKRSIAPSEDEEEKDPGKEEKDDPKEYVFPGVDLLKKGKIESADSRQELADTAEKLKSTLASFGINVEVTDISQGPSVTRYEIKIEQGVKVSRILSLSDDLKLNLAATDVRIEAPIPGKAAVGIEIPNKKTTTVMLRDIIDSDEFRNEKSKIGFVVGKDIAGKNVVADIEDMPHLLIAGATGSGKSVCVNTIIMSLLYKAKPDEVKLILIDPKRVELSMYNGLPHLMAPVVTDPNKAAGALHWGVTEMTRRFDLFEKMRVRDLKSYNARVKKLSEGEHEPEYDDDGNELPLPSPLPQVIIIVDEMADLMMVAKSEVETYICRLAQLARAAGIHLIIATQRPSVDVITGLIKANMPSRIAFMVSSGTDSRTILEGNGAEKLLGKGDMLFSPRNYPKPERIQGPYVSEAEVQSVVDFIIEKNSTEEKQDISEEIEAHTTVAKENDNTQDNLPADASGDEKDPYFEDAGRFIIERQKASIGILQRMFRIGFNRAARIMDQLAEAGVVSHEDGTKARQILMTMDEFEDLLE